MFPIYMKLFPPNDKKLLQDSFNRTKKQNPKTKTTKSFKKLLPKDQFILIAVSIQSFLRAAIINKRKSLKNGELIFQCECGQKNLAELPDSLTNPSPEAIRWACPGCDKKYQFEFSFSRE